MTAATFARDLLHAHPEIAFFLVLGLGYLLGKISLGGFKLGAVTGTLARGRARRPARRSRCSNDVKQCFFLLFLFAIGFRTGPQFFRGLRSDGLAHAALAAIVAVAGLLAAYAVSRLFGYDAGTAAGLVAGALTESATIGTAMDTIAKLDVTEAERTAMTNNIPVAFSVTYLIGVTAAAWILSQLGPKLLRVDLAEECRKLEAQMQDGDAAATRRAPRVRDARLRRRRGLAMGRTANRGAGISRERRKNFRGADPQRRPDSRLRRGSDRASGRRHRRDHAPHDAWSSD